ADAHHAQNAKAVGDRARDRLAQSPQQVLQRERQAEHVAAPGEVTTHRLHEEAEARTRTKTQQRNRAAADDDHERGTPAADAGGRTKIAGADSHDFPLQFDAPGMPDESYRELMHLHENPRAAG